MKEKNDFSIHLEHIAYIGGRRGIRESERFIYQCGAIEKTGCGWDNYNRDQSSWNGKVMTTLILPNPLKFTVYLFNTLDPFLCQRTG